MGRSRSGDRPERRRPAAAWYELSLAGAALVALVVGLKVPSLIHAMGGYSIVPAPQSFAQIGAMASQGFTEIQSTSGSADFSLDDVAAILRAGLKASAPSGDQVAVADAGASFANLTLQQIGGLGQAGFGQRLEKCRAGRVVARGHVISTVRPSASTSRARPG